MLREEFVKFASVLGDDPHQVMDILIRYGFTERKFTVEENHQGKNVVYQINRTTYYDGKISHYPLLCFEPKTQLFWFEKITKILMFALMDAVPTWDARNLKGFKLGKNLTGLNNYNSVKFSELSTVLDEVYKVLNEEIQNMNVNISEHQMSDALVSDQIFSLGHKTSRRPKIKIKRFQSMLLFLAGDLDLENALILDKAGVSYEQVQDYDLSFGAEILIELVK